MLTLKNTGVKYFSVAARTTQMSIWHPLWLPKLIVDAAEEQEAYNAQASIASQASPVTSQPLSLGADVAVSYPDKALAPDPHFTRGNDGLVTISSAKWGTFLGTVEGCDHWELRGARGLNAIREEGWGKMWQEWIGQWRDSSTAKGDGIWKLLGGRSVSGGSRDETETNGGDWVMKNGLGSKFNLERFYVALSRKMYDEGL
jgi:hypothetical protein